MANWRYRRLLRQAWHPPDEELLLYVEGEADARSTRHVSDHLSSCWTCRARRDEIERAIGAYMAYHRDPAHAAGASGANGGDDPEQTKRRFAAALARAQQDAPASRSASPSSLPGRSFGRSWRMPRLRVVAWPLARAAALLVVIVFASRWWLAPAPVSARELLARVDRAQQQEIAAVADPVIYQRLHASRASTNDTVTWEVWSSQRQRRIVERVSAASALLLDLQTLLRENGMEPAQPLSPASLTAWRRSAGHVAEDVRETKLSDGTAAVTLTSSAPGPVQEGRIARSEVVVRTRDWHPVAHILTVAGAAGQQQRYTITELNYRVVPLETVETRIFNPPAIVPSVDADDATADAPAARPAPAIHPARAALLALYEEHTTGECLRDRAFADAAASGSGGGNSGDPSPSPLPASGARVPDRAPSPRLRGEGRHPNAPTPRVGGPGWGEGLGADTAMRHLWAIRQLAEWYRSTQHDGLERGLDRTSASLLATMVREHLNAARQLLPASGEAAPAEASDVSPGEPWTTVAMKAYAAVEYASRAGAPEAAGAADAATRQDAVVRARALLRALDAAVQRLAPGAASGATPPAASTVTPRHDRP